MWSAHIRDKLASSSMLLNPTTATRSSSTNLGRMEMCAKRPSFKRTAKPQKLFGNGLQLRIHLCRLRCCTSSLHSTLLNHHDFSHKASSCVHFAFEAANHDMSNVCYNPHTLSQRRDWRTAAQATMDVQTAETRLLTRVPLVPSVPSWLCFGWLVPALQVARLSFGMKGSALDSPHRPQLGEAMTSRTPASWNMSD